jgi:hypothetical protein
MMPIHVSIEHVQCVVWISKSCLPTGMQHAKQGSLLSADRGRSNVRKISIEMFYRIFRPVGSL